ncbi:hypothetical protein B0I35DRAFT_416967 [Stachybotrys elegans]|uniref:Uncharacterized protein n=1 Tax=Stachybotrys elegans TaxID=80388 RepID=A0A8K0T6F9_9HYPO|nr:hypothetical protein B0I35DRAFT_416967 [Stachybotrys elegans]
MALKRPHTALSFCCTMHPIMALLYMTGVHVIFGKTRQTAMSKAGEAGRCSIVAVIPDNSKAWKRQGRKRHIISTDVP